MSKTIHRFISVNMEMLKDNITHKSLIYNGFGLSDDNDIYSLIHITEKITECVSIIYHFG